MLFISDKMADEDSDDLPLSSNIKEIRVRHYIITIIPDLTACQVHGKVILILGHPSKCEQQGKCCDALCRCNPFSSGRDVCDEENTELEPKPDHSNVEPDLRLVLDMKDIHICKVSQVLHQDKEILPYYNPSVIKNDSASSRKWFDYETRPLKFNISQNSVCIVKEGITSLRNFPKVILIEYHSMAGGGTSLTWGQDGRAAPYCYTAGSPINNRSLLPYQDAPGAMATWETNVIVPKWCHVSMSGDQSARETPILLPRDNCFKLSGLQSCSKEEEKTANFAPDSSFGTDGFLLESKFCYFFTALPLPLATLAVAVGQWSVAQVISTSASDQRHPIRACNKYGCAHSPYPCLINKQFETCANTVKVDNLLVQDPANNCLEDEFGSCSSVGGEEYLLPTTLVYPAGEWSRLQHLVHFLPHCVRAASQLLGPHPCPRLEVLVLPYTASALGLASPNLLFLAPCVSYVGNLPSFIRVAHEIRWGIGRPGY